MGNLTPRRIGPLVPSTDFDLTTQNTVAPGLYRVKKIIFEGIQGGFRGQTIPCFVLLVGSLVGSPG